MSQFQIHATIETILIKGDSIMKQKYTQKQKYDVIKRYLASEQVVSIHKRTGISRSTIYGWINEHKNNHNVEDHAINGSE